MPRMFVPAAILAAAVVLAGCAAAAPGDGTAESSPHTRSPSSTPASTATADPTPPPASEPTPQVPASLDLRATTIDGESFDLASLAGTPVFVWFWAPWCPVCAREAPLIAELAGSYSDRVSFVGVAGLSADLAAMQDFVDDGGLDAVPHLDDRDGAVYAHFGVTQQYDIGLVTAAGELEIVTGPLSEGEIRDAVERLAAG